MKNIYGRWKRIAEKIGNFQVNAVFSLLYFFLFAPVGLFVSRFLNIFNKGRSPKWEKVTNNAGTLMKLRDQ